MIKLIQIEWLKLSLNFNFKLVIALLLLIFSLLAYLFASGFQFKPKIDEAEGLLMWRTILPLFFTFSYVLWLCLAMLFMISWQQHEHLDNTLKLYEVIPFDTFLAIQIRFNLYYLLMIIIYVISLAIGFKIIEMIWISKSVKLPYSLELDKSTISYIFEGLKAVILLSYPVFLALFVISTKTSKVIYSFLALFFFITISFIPLPNWFFTNSLNGAFKCLRLIYGYGRTEMIDVLRKIYLYNAFSSIVIISFMFYLINSKQLFSKYYGG